MTDRELIEKAAKAAGIVRDGTDDSWYQSGGGWVRADWNPLSDDGDALRLAVKCAAQIHWHVGNVVVVAIVGIKPIDVREPYGEDMDVAAATRRAIVRVAAAIGEQT